MLPDIERAILSRHNIVLLGLRGQAKTRLARMLVQLLDEWMPIVAGSELNDDPLAPISRFAFDLMAEMGDATPIEWVHRNDRYVEKLATPRREHRRPRGRRGPHQGGHPQADLLR